MKKALMVTVILVASLAFLALPNSQAGAAKPVKWKATVTGDIWKSGEFVGGVDHVNINNGTGTNPYSCGPTGNSYSYLELQVFMPSLQFSMDWSALSCPPGDLNNGLGKLPGTALPWPFCLADFLAPSYLHPTADYPHIIVRFTTCGCGNTITDLMAMNDGDILPVRMSVLFFSHIWSCPPNSNTFLNLNMNAHGWVKDGGSLPDIYIKRVGNVWTAYVDTAFDNPAYQQSISDYTSADWPVMKSDNILGQYATCSSLAGKRGKTTWTTTFHYPQAKAPLNFQVAFTKY